MTEPLHLPNLSIENFRAIDRLEIPKLGRVTLIVGENSVGKTTILDAVRVFADRGNFLTLRSLLRDREEVLIDESVEDAPVRVPNWPALFHGRDAGCPMRIKVVNREEPHLLQLDAAYASSEQVRLANRRAAGRIRVLRVSFNGASIEHPYQAELSEEFSSHGLLRGADRALDGRLARSYAEDWPFPRLPYESIGPDIIDSDRIARYLDRVALTSREHLVVDALRLIFGETVERIAAVADDGGGRLRRSSRRTLVKLSNEKAPVPLASLGDGAIRLLGVGLAIANAGGGLLLIDEAENGLHHRRQADFWRMIIRAARESNVQVIATTHSWDCVRGFQRASAEELGESAVLYRLERGKSGLRLVGYDEDRLGRAAEQHVEVR